jgi:hypothetical protein
MKRDILDDPVALVEDAEHRNPLGHGRHAPLSVHGRARLMRRWQRYVLLLRALAAPGERKRDQKRNCRVSHAYSGIQGS